MAPSKPLLVSALLLGGTAAALLGKWQDMICVGNCDGAPGAREHYEQPVWQTLQMFLGEMLCFLPLACIAARPRDRLPDAEQHGEGPAPTPLRGWAVLKLWLPAFCDLSGSTLSYVGLLYMPVSIFQMTRGGLVLFVGLFSALFLGRRLFLYQWLALVCVMAGVALVGLCGYLIDARAPPALAARADGGPAAVTSTLFGAFFVLAANLFQATQFIVEESLLTRHTAPALAVVAFEGLFGTLSLLLLMALLVSLSPTTSPSATVALPPALDLAAGLEQILTTPRVQASAALMALVLGLVNFLAVLVTRYAGATARSLVDTARTLLIWAGSVLLGWERVAWPASALQVAGFAMLVYGTMLYNDFLRPPPCLRPPPTAAPRIPLRALAHADDSERAALLRAEDGPDDSEALGRGADAGADAVRASVELHGARQLSLRGRSPGRADWV